MSTIGCRFARVEVSADLVAQTPIHVGGPEPGLIVDRLAAVDGAGRYYLPGSSLAGSMRASLRDRGVDVDELWGPQDCSSASAVWVDDAPMVPTENWHSETRDGVTIDLRTGTASHNLLYTTQVLPSGSTFQATVAVEARSGVDADDALAMAGMVARLWTESGLQVGANSTKGMGLLRAGAARVEVIRLDTAEQLLTGLLDGPEEVNREEWAELPTVPQISLVIPWRPRGPILVSRALSGSRADTVPLSTSVGSGDERLVLPGSAIKGALRAQAERIVNTVGGSAVARRALVDLFGTGAEGPELREVDQVSDRGDGQAGRGGPLKGHLRVEEVRSTRALAVGSLMTGEAPSDPHAVPWDFGDHVAVDRWTGGARDGALYCVIEPSATSATDWESLRFVLSAHRQDESRLKAATALLVLVLRDLAEGWFGIGYGTARGYGALDIHLNESKLQASGPIGEWWDSQQSDRTLAEVLGAPEFRDWLQHLWDSTAERGGPDA